MRSKELGKLMAVLSNDRLVQTCVPSTLISLQLTSVDSYRQNELKEGAQRSVGKQYYYIDYKHFCNVVKWRVARMHSIIDSTLRNVRHLLFLCLDRDHARECRNSTTRATSALNVTSRTLPWMFSDSWTTLAGRSSAKTAVRSWSTTRTPRTSRAVKTGCKDSISNYGSS